MTHTPGPWEVGPRGKYYQQHYRTIIVEDPLLGTNEVAWVICDWDETEPDAALIAAAPELLEACYKTLDGMYNQFPQYETISNKELQHPDMECYAIEVILQIRAAIAKAEREQ